MLKAEDSPRLPTLRKLVAAEADAFHPVAPLPPAAGTARAGAVVARVPLTRRRVTRRRAVSRRRVTRRRVTRRRVTHPPPRRCLERWSSQTPPRH